MVTLHVGRTIAAPPEQVFAWLADPANLIVAPMVVRTGWAANSAAPGVGAVRAVIATGMWFREEFTAYDPPRAYTYRIVRAVPAFNNHSGTLTFTPSGNRTHVDWTISYSHPVHAGGRAMEAVSSRLLPWNFRAILAGCAQALER
ncbi:MAG: SRPBCC family protein [Mycobacterium sp.]|nr:SRPBCC family protein [Mycobacterium sp.]